VTLTLVYRSKSKFNDSLVFKNSSRTYSTFSDKYKDLKVNDTISLTIREKERFNLHSMDITRFKIIN